MDCVNAKGGVLLVVSGTRTGVILVLEDQGGFVPRQRMMPSEAAHDGKVAQDVVRHPEEAVTVLGRPRALVGALPPGMRVEDEAVHVPHLHARDLIHRKPGNGEALQVHGVPVGIAACVDRLVHVLKEDPVRRRQCRLHVAQYSAQGRGRDGQQRNSHVMGGEVGTRGASEITCADTTHRALQKKSNAAEA